MTPQDAFYQTVHAYPGGCESLGPRLGTSAAVLRAKANPNSDRNHPTLADIDKVMGLRGITGCSMRWQPTMPMCACRWTRT